MASNEMNMADRNGGSLTLTVPQAHALIGKANIGRVSLYAAIGRGEIPSVRLGKRILIPRQRFLEWLATPAGIRGKAELVGS